MRWTLALTFLWAFFAADHALAVDLLPLFELAAADLDVPVALTKAIAEVESGQSPYALNVGGKGYFFQSKEDAIFAARQAQAEGKSFDSGPMQINSQWLKRFNIPLEAAFDPEANVYLGTWLLQQNLQAHGDWQTAVARYHSADQERGQRYVDKVKAALGRTEEDQPEKLQLAMPSQSDQGTLTPLVISHGMTNSEHFVQRPGKIFHRCMQIEEP